MKKIVITKNDENQRLDRFITKLFSNAPKNYLMKMFRKNYFKVNSKKVKPDYILNNNDEISIFFSDDTYEKFVKKKKNHSNKNINIIYEDEFFLIVDKDPGILSHSNSKDRSENIIDNAINYLIESGSYNPRGENTFIPALCNRLDRNTSGLVIIGKTKEALTDMNSYIKDRLVSKEYLTIVSGNFDKNGIFHSKICKDENKNIVYKSDSKDAREIITEFSVIEKNQGYSLLNIKLITGKTHQIRYHLKELGFPIIGDRKYNELYRGNYKNQILCAYKLSFDDEVIKKYPKLNKILYSNYMEKIINIFRRLKWKILF